jgi:hypothetical protein
MPQVVSISTFSLEAHRWVATSSHGDFDLVVPDEGGKPDERAVALLEQALGEIEQLLFKAHKYVTAFCHPAEAGEAEMPSLVEVSVVDRRGGPKVYLAFNYSEDTYGLWSVGFSRSEKANWDAVSFMREAW